MQKNVPKYTPDWVPTVSMWAEASQARGALRAVQRPAHAAVVRATSGPSSTTRRSIAPPARPTMTHLVLDLDPPEGDGVRGSSCAVAHLVRQALADVGLAGGA